MKSPTGNSGGADEPARGKRHPAGVEAGVGDPVGPCLKASRPRDCASVIAADAPSACRESRSSSVPGCRSLTAALNALGAPRRAWVPRTRIGLAEDTGKRRRRVPFSVRADG